MVVRINSATPIFCVTVIGGDCTRVAALTGLSLQATFCSVSHPVSQQRISFLFSNKCNLFSYEKWTKSLPINKRNEWLLSIIGTLWKHIGLYICIVVSRKGTQWQSTLQACQRGGVGTLNYERVPMSCLVNSSPSNALKCWTNSNVQWSH